MYNNRKEAFYIGGRHVTNENTDYPKGLTRKNILNK